MNSGRLPVYRAYPVPDDERFLREFMLQLKLGRVETASFVGKFGKEPSEVFAGPLAALRSEGHLVEGPGWIGLTRAALLQVDSLLPLFFKPEHRTGRYA